MSSQTSLFLPPNAFVEGGAYAASLIGSNSDTMTLAVQCTSAQSKASGDCGPTASTTTITVAPTSFALTTLSTAAPSVVTLTETCVMAPAMSSAACNILADSGLSAPFNVTDHKFEKNIHLVNITNAAAQTTATSTSSATTTNSTSSTTNATAATATTTTTTTTTGSSSGIKLSASSKSGTVLLAACALFAIIRL